jgi:hypothetical protein
VGELRLLSPALVSVAKRTIVLVDPPHPPQILALAGLGLASSQVIWIRSGGRTADALCVMDEKKSHRKIRRKPLMGVCSPVNEVRGLSLCSFEEERQTGFQYKKLSLKTALTVS